MGRGKFLGHFEALAEEKARAEGYADLKTMLKFLINSGVKKSELARTFSVNRHTIDNWLAKRKLEYVHRARYAD